MSRHCRRQSLNGSRYGEDSKMSEQRNERGSTGAGIAGLLVLGCLVVGIAGIVGVVVCMEAGRDTTGAAVSLLASAIAFGLGANAVTRR